MAGTIGIACFYPNSIGQANINQAIAKIVVSGSDETLKTYLVEILNSSICRLQAKRALTVSAQPNLNFEQIKSLLIPLPTNQRNIQQIVDYCQSIRYRIQKIRIEAEAELAATKRRIESILLGEVTI